MLRIHRDDVDDHRAVLVLEGRIAGAWAVLLERECEALMKTGLGVDLDLSEVVYIARAGLEALRRLLRAGVRITGCSPLLAAMLAQEGIR
jgi:anti-anti-sigma regulatory factor